LQPPVELLVHGDYALGRASDGYVGPRRGGQNVWFHLDEFGAETPAPIYASGLQDLCEQIVVELADRGMIGVYVAPEPTDIDPETGADLRDGSTDLHLLVHTGRVQSVRTFRTATAAGAAPRAEPIEADSEGIAARSPLQPVGAGDPIDKHRLDAYVAGLNRHPGRAVDVVLTPTLTPGLVNLDYLVDEDRPWTIASGVSNTGTAQTGRFRQHFSFSDYQLTGHDDVLLVDYTTAGFSNVNAANGSYEGILPFTDSLRWRIGGGYSEYQSDQFGFSELVNGATTRQKLSFSGNQIDLSGELVASLIQEPGFFLDGNLGARWMRVNVDNVGFGATVNFLVPELSFTLDRLRPTSRLHTRLGFEQAVPGLASSSSRFADFALISRDHLDDDWRVLSLDTGGSFFLEPIFHGTRFFSPRPLRPRELTQELAWRFSGQTSLGTRVIPQVEGVLGGAGSVRGYPQSIVSGDQLVLGSLEYRYHVPLAFGHAVAWEVPWLGEFRPAPDASNRMPDWDLVLATFVDAGRVFNQSPVPGEADTGLASVGVGIEIVVRQNFSVRLDYGFALIDVPGAKVTAGDGEAHFTALMRY
jgi:hypothetical protein